jgi:DNA-binding NarL/FixJ family response regulator
MTQGIQQVDRCLVRKSVGDQIRILIADNLKLVADGCKQMLEPEFNVIGIVTNGRALVQTALKLKPNVVILEVDLPQLNGLGAAGQIKRNLPSLKVVFLAASSDVNAAAAAFQWGASAYVLKQSDGDELITAVRRVLRGESYLSPLIARETIECLLQPAKHQTLGQQLTLREIEVLQLLAEGRSMKEVAHVLEIASRTVAFHKYKMMEKLGIRTNAGLFQYAMKHYMTHIQGSWVVTDSHGVRLMEAS